MIATPPKPRLGRPQAAQPAAILRWARHDGGLYHGPMQTFMTIAIIAGLVSVLAVLLLGVGSMLVGGEWNRKHGNQLMRLRVLLQFGTVILLLIFFLLHGH